MENQDSCKIDAKTLIIGVLGGIVIGLVGGAFLFGVASKG